MGAAAGSTTRNALRHGEPDGVVELRVHRETDRLVFAVLNRGQTIADADKVRVFEPFQRLSHPNGHQGTSERVGMGLGLAVCKAISKAHEGSLWIEDRPGGGSKVCFALTIDEGSQTA